jgi:hypothetical protein
LARVSFSNACLSPLLIACANSTSSSTVIKSSRPISCRYLSREALSRFVIDFVIFSCLILYYLYSNLFFSPRFIRGCKITIYFSEFPSIHYGISINQQQRIKLNFLTLCC